MRSLESYGRAVERSDPRARTAVGLAGLERRALGRGDVLVTDELPWAATSALDVEITLLPGTARPLKPRTRVRLHLGTVEVMARVLPRLPIEPGGTGMARLSLEKALVARAEDRFVLRSYSPVTTIGGGRVLDPLLPLAEERGLRGWLSRSASAPGRAGTPQRGDSAATLPAPAWPFPDQRPQRSRGEAMASLVG